MVRSLTPDPTYHAIELAELSGFDVSSSKEGFSLAFARSGRTACSQRVTYLQCDREYLRQRGDDCAGGAAYP